MHFICLCPTYGRPSLVANSVQLFLAQQLRDGDSAHLFVFDDAGQIARQAHGDPRVDRLSWHVTSQDEWIALPRKYNAMLELLDNDLMRRPGVSRRETCYVVWDDDDVYLPWHLRNISRAFELAPWARWAHPSRVYSTYDERRPPLIPRSARPIVESACGRFHGALAVRGDWLGALGGWPDSDLATFDQQMLAIMSHVQGVDTVAPNTAVDQPISYVYRWQDTGRWHASGSIDEVGRYRKPPVQEEGHVGIVTPMYDASTLQIRWWFVDDATGVTHAVDKEV